MKIFDTISYDPRIIIAIVAKEYRVSEDEMLDKVSKHGVCDARHAAMCLIRLKNPKLAQGRIAAIFGKDVGKFTRAAKCVEALLKTDKIFKLRFEICKMLTNQVK